VPGWSVRGRDEAARQDWRPSILRADPRCRDRWPGKDGSAEPDRNFDERRAGPEPQVRRPLAPPRRRTASPIPIPSTASQPPIMGDARTERRIRASLEDLPIPFPTAFTSLPPCGGAPGPYQPGQVRGHQPRTSTSRSRMPLIGLVRLQRALRAAMPCSTQSVTEEVPGDANFPAAIAAAAKPAEPAPGEGDMKSLGDTDTGLVATRVALPGRRGGTQSVRGAASDGRTSAAHVGVTAPGEIPASPRGEIWIGWYCRAQAGQIDE